MKGKFCCFCGRKLRQQKTDEDLRAVLQKHWDQNQTNLNAMYYSIYWNEDLIKAIRKGNFTASDIATMRTSEAALSMLALMPRTE